MSKDNKIDLLVQQYEQFVISKDESIDSIFARFNTIITSLKALDEGYSSKNFVRKFLRVLHPKWRAKVMAIKESGVRLLEIVRREYAMAVSETLRIFFRVIREIHSERPKDIPKKPVMDKKNQRAFVGGSWSDSDEQDDENVKNEMCLVDQASSELGLGFNSFKASSSGTKEIKFVKAQKKASSHGGPINMGDPLSMQAAPKAIMGPPPAATSGSEKSMSFQKSILGPRPKHIIVNNVKVLVASDNEVKQFYKPLSKPEVGFSKPNFRSKTPPPRRVINNYSRPKTPQPKRNVGRTKHLVGCPICLGVNLEPDEWIKDSGCSKHMTGNRKLFSSYKAYNGGNVIFGSNLCGNIISKGQIYNKCRVTFSEYDSEITKDGKVIGD
ncbi:hypothetical protein Tco_1571455 [Tanacetum coccineum]